MCNQRLKGFNKLYVFPVSVVTICFVFLGGVYGVAEQNKRTEGFIRGKMRPMHFSNIHRTFWNGGSYGQPSPPWKPQMRLSPYSSPPLASSLVSSGDSLGNARPFLNGGVTGMGDDKGKFVPFIGARALSNLPGFFEQLRHNVEIMREQEQKNVDEDEGTKESPDYPQDESEIENKGNDMEVHEAPRALALSAAGNQEWMWPAAIFFRGKNLAARSI